MTSKLELGKFGEGVACKYLVSKGYKIIERNYRKPWGEIDIISRDPEGILVFIEVKTVGDNYGDSLSITPEDQLTHSKLKKLQRTASLYMECLPANINNIDNNDFGWRIDLLALTIQGKNCLVKHYKNI